MKVFAAVCLVCMYAVTRAIKPVQEKLVKPYYHESSRQQFNLPNPRRNDSYFGFSITYDNYRKSLVISSPRYDEIGKVYDCHIKKETCVPLITSQIHREPNYPHDYWLGATVKAGPDFIVTCAPRYTVTYTKSGNGKKGTFAECYTRNTISDQLELRYSITKSMRNNDYNNELLKDPAGLTKVERFMDSFGWSIDVATTKTSSPVIIGGPAMYTGRVMVYDNIIRGNPKLLDRNKERSEDLPEYNYGYSVASGYFFNRRQLVYAVGSTYGREGAGSVHFFNTDRVRLSQLKKSVDEDTVGSMFGAVLCAAKFYENGLTGLLVGAPTYASKHEINMGLVYVYLNTKETRNNNMRYHRVIVNGKEGSYFGSAIANLGDLNGDKRDEIAIAAPYEDNGRGAVYLYSGADIVSKATTITWMQRIQPEGFTSFGLSLTALNDYDENGCNELAIGAPYDDAVVLYRCMTAITVRLKTQFPTNVQDRTRENITNFEYRVCFEVTYPEKPKHIIADISTRVVFTHSSAKLTNPNSGDAYIFNTSLADPSSPHCTFVGFTLPSDGNYETEISISVTSKLLNDPYSQPFDGSRVVLSDRSELTKQDSQWVAECSGDKECLPNLTLTFVDQTKVPYIIGSSETKEFSISVSNTGDIAYDSFVLVSVFGATVHSSSQQCVLPKFSEEVQLAPGADHRLCAPNNPIKTNDTWNSGAIFLNMADLTNKDDKITIQAQLFKHRKDLNKSNITYEHIVRLKSDPNYITIKGISNIGEAINITGSELSTGKVMEHKYTITNNGKTRWSDAKCDIVIERTPIISILSVEMSDLEKTYVCMQTSETSETVKSTCMIPSIEPSNRKLSIESKTLKNRIELVILIRVMSDKIDDVPKEGVTAKTTIHLYLDAVDKTKSVSTLIQVDDARVAWWVILIAVLLGILILCIIACVLYKCGFLRREKKKDLQALQKSIKRQTIRMSRVPPMEDQKQILEQVQEENEGTQQIDNRAFCEASEDTSKPETEDSDVCKTKQ